MPLWISANGRAVGVGLEVSELSYQRYGCAAPQCLMGVSRHIKRRNGTVAWKTSTTHSQRCTTGCWQAGRFGMTTQRTPNRPFVRRWPANEDRGLRVCGFEGECWGAREDGPGRQNLLWTILFAAKKTSSYDYNEWSIFCRKLWLVL